MRMQICIDYANFIGPLALIFGQSRLARPGLTKDLQIAKPSFGRHFHTAYFAEVLTLGCPWEYSPSSLKSLEFLETDRSSDWL